MDIVDKIVNVFGNKGFEQFVVQALTDIQKQGEKIMATLDAVKARVLGLEHHNGSPTQED